MQAEILPQGSDFEGCSPPRARQAKPTFYLPLVSMHIVFNRLDPRAAYMPNYREEKKLFLDLHSTAAQVGSETWT